MQKGNVSIAKKTLLLLETQSFEKIVLSKIIMGQKTTNIKNKKDLLININKYFDYLLKEELKSLEKSSTRDMLFEVVMARLDIINIYRKSIKNLIKYFLSKPHQFIKLLPSFLDTTILIATLSDIDVSGVKGVPKIKSIFILYCLIIYTWYNDETDSLEKTMTTLDMYLNNLEKLKNYING